MKYQGFVGKTDSGEAVYVEVEVTTTKLNRPQQTTTHETISEATRVSISGHYFAKGSRRKDWSGGGQITDTVAAVTRPAMGFTVADVARLVEIWKSQHLNDMKAGCAHQTPVWREGKYRREYDLDNTPVCPETGYRFGSAWLYEEPSSEMLADLERLGAMLDGEDGLRS